MFIMETNMPDRAETDRRMWFSMWFLASIATFGLAFFPMLYRSIERRNQHFRRQFEWEKRATVFFESREREGPPAVSLVPERNARLWTVSVILVFPVFIIAYFLSKDLLSHEKRQQEFLKTLFPEEVYSPQKVPLGKYSLFTLATLGLGVIYWFYKILNMYNNHFKEHQKIEDEIVRLMEAKSHGEPV
jgi:hypothetical protein